MQDGIPGDEWFGLPDDAKSEFVGRGWAAHVAGIQGSHCFFPGVGDGLGGGGCRSGNRRGDCRCRGCRWLCGLCVGSRRKQCGTACGARDESCKLGANRHSANRRHRVVNHRVWGSWVRERGRRNSAPIANPEVYGCFRAFVPLDRSACWCSSGCGLAPLRRVR